MRVTTRGRAELDGLDSADISYLKSIGRDPEAIAWQVRILRGSRTPVPIVRPATMGDGVRQLESFDRTALEALRARAAAEGRLSSFIPASGSGTRLFQSLQQLAREQDVRLDDVRHRAAQGDAAAADALVVFET
jgi:hypothetical protein